jgi:hypothetical protein
VLAVAHSLRGVSDFFSFFAENRSKQPFFAGKLLLTLRRNFTYKNIAGVYFRANSDNTVFVQVP